MVVTEISNRTHGCRKTEICRVSDIKRQWSDKPIDKCLVSIVRALNATGLWTAFCCCGHGITTGTIILHNKITLTIPRCKKYG